MNPFSWFNKAFRLPQAEPTPPPPPSKLGFLVVTCKGGEELKIRVAKLELRDKALCATSASFTGIYTIVAAKLLDDDFDELIEQKFDYEVTVCCGDCIVLVVGIS